MDVAEADALVRVQERYLNTVTAKTHFTAAFIRQMHKDWLGSLYDWAGQYRTVDLTKRGFTWLFAGSVGENMERFERSWLARKTPFRPLSRAQAARDLAIMHSELLFIHPFREGNGRIARWLVSLLCLQADLPDPAYGLVGKNSRRQRERYLQAVRQGYDEEYDALTEFFAEALVRADSE